MENSVIDNIKTCLQQYQDPYLQMDLVSARALKKVEFKDNKAIVDIVLGYPIADVKEKLIEDLQQFLANKLEIKQIEININWQVEPHATQAGLPVISNIKNIIAIASGKGGVGKSTVTVNLALALMQAGARVGILDADIYGPNQPQMLGVNTQPEILENKHFRPIISHGIQSMSIGYLVNSNTPMIWRGPMVSTALQQLLRDTHWDHLDYLFIDLPPGTGDIQLTLAQKVPVSGAVVVTTPQEIALLDVRKAVEMFNKVKVPVLGLVENMSTHICSHCGHEEAIFGNGGGEQMARDYHLELLGQLPLDISIRQYADSGNPTVVAEPNSDLAWKYREIARKVAAKLSLQVKNYAAKFPKIVVEGK